MAIEGGTISPNHFPQAGSRSLWASTASLASWVNVTPVGEVVATRATRGCLPFQGMGRAHGSPVSIESSTVPFPWFSQMPHQRAIGLYLL
jgi:hypothetical protein